MKIIIKNFKSIKKIEMKIKDGLQYLVGKNESGKSNILEAFKRLSTKELTAEDKNINSEEKDNLEITYVSSSQANLIEKWKQFLKIDNNEKDFFSTLDENDLKTFWEQSFFKESIISTIEKWKEYFYDENILKKIKKDFFNKQMIKIVKEEREMLMKGKFSTFQLNYYERGFYSFLQKLEKLVKETIEILVIPDIFIFRRDKILAGKYAYEDISQKTELKGLWKKIGIQPQVFQKLIKIREETNFSAQKKTLEAKINKKLVNFLDEEIKHTRGIKLEVELGDKELKFIPRDVFDDGQELGNYGDLRTRSEGIKSFLIIYLFLAGIEEDDQKEKIILLDEPDLHLHASAVLDLKDYFEEIVKNNPKFKILVITHNPYFIDDKNFHKINLIVKENKQAGTQLIENFARKTGEEKWETFSPFFYKLGIDKAAFIQLKNAKGIHLFVEGFQDMVLLNAMKNYLKIKKEIFIIPKNSATRNNYSLISLVSAFNQKLPYFIFDYDQAGAEGLKQIKNDDLYSSILKNAFFINLADEYQKGDSKIETQNLFGDDQFLGKNIAETKNTSFYLQLAEAMKEKNFSLSQKTIKNFQKIFNRITKNKKINS